jgi:superfamily II DNA or RNA helicase
VATPLYHSEDFRRLVLDRLKKPATSFKEIHAAISSLSEEHERGLAFEVFAEATLMTDPALQAKAIYTMATLPLHLLDRLKQKPHDFGIDRIIETINGTLIAVQVKFRIDPSNSVRLKEIEGFLFQSQHADARLVVTTSDRTVFERKLRKDVIVQKIVGRDLFSLSPQRIFEIVSYIESGIILAPKRMLERDDQLISVARIVSGLQLHDRGIFDAACASGKTLVSERVIEMMFGLRGGLVLCLAPSLNLVQQTIRSHARELAGQGSPYSFAVVCSDNTVTDGISTISAARVSDLAIEDMGVPVTTDAGALATFLRRPRVKGEIRIIFSTYQSGRVIEEALKATGLRVDLTICDEAHKTVTSRSKTGHDRDFALSLFNEHIPARKRLFMTATKRIRKLAKGRIEDTTLNHLSMDQEAQYGPVLHRFSHAQAIAKGIIRAPKLLLCAVDPNQLPANLRDLDVALDGQPMTGEAAAEYLALRQAIEISGARKIVTFHTRTSDAKRFSKFAKRVMPDFSIGHVSCEQRVSEREKNVDFLRNDTRPALVTNVRCLAEGVDIPEIDMVCLFGNFASVIDITQIIGRALRKPLGCSRSYGYILLPVIVTNLNATASAEDMLEAAGLKTIRQAICALMDMDEQFAELVQTYRQAKGRNDRKAISAITREVGRHFECIGFASAALSKAMTTSILGDIGEDFWFHLGELESFVLREGHANLPPGFVSSSGKNLYVWLDNQKIRIREGKMPQDRLDALTILGVSTVGYGERLDARLKMLASFHAEKGHLTLPTTAEFKSLRAFVSRVRRQHKAGKLEQSVRTFLGDLGFAFDLDNDADYRSGLDKLRAFFAANGHSTVSRTHADRDLTRFCEKMKADRRADKLDASKIRQLDALQFPWNARVEQARKSFETMMLILQDMYRQTGSAAVPRTYVTPDGFAVGRQLDQCRQRLRCNELSGADRQLLKAVGITEPVRIDLVERKKTRIAAKRATGPSAEERRRDATFSEFLTVLKRYIAQGGLPDVPQNGEGSVFEGQNLGNRQNHWLKAWRKGTLSSDQVAVLEQLGVSKYRSKAAPIKGRRKAA